MHSQNSNNDEPFDIKASSEFYNSKLPHLSKRIETIEKQLKMPLNYIFPSDFQEKYQQAKNCELIDSLWIENYKEIVAFIIQGQINTPLMRLSEKFRHQFGGQTMFWLDLICSFAQNQKYEENFRIWQVNDVYKHCLHLQKGEYQKNRKFRKLAKHDIQVSKKLISSIHQLKNAIQNQPDINPVQDFLSKVETNYGLHEDSNKKIIDFLRSQEHKNLNLDFFEVHNPIFHEKKSPNSSLSSSRTKKTQKERDRYQNILKQRMITDFSVNFREDKNSSLLRKIVGKNEISQEQLQEKKQLIEKSFKNLSQNNNNFENLRHELFDKQPKHLRKIEPSLSNIFISYSYLRYNDFFISSERQEEFQLSQPFGQFPNVNYDNNDYEEYQEILGEELMENQEVLTDDESLDTIEKLQMIEESNPYEMDDEDMQVFKKAIRKDPLFFGKPWIMNLTSEHPIQFIQNEAIPDKGPITSEMIQQFLDQSSTMCLCPSQIPMKSTDPPNQHDLTQEDIQILKKIFHMKTYKEGMAIIQEDQSLSAQFKKNKIDKFIHKMTKRVQKKVDGKKINIYHVLEQENKLQNQVPTIIINKIIEIDEVKSLTDQPTYIDDPDFQKQNVQQTKKVRIVKNYQSQNTKLSSKSSSKSASFSNKQSLRSSKRTKQLQKGSDTLSDTSQAVSMRLRQRSSKPVYNFETLLGRKTRKKQKQEQQECQI